MKVENEVWKIIPGWENYSISNWGNVKNNKTGYILKHTIRKGYHGVTLYRDNGKEYKIIRIHVCMVRVFTNNFNKALVAAHLDGNQDNNRLDNIALVSQKENIEHKFLHNTIARGSHHGMAKLDEEKVREIRNLIATNKYSNKKIARMYGVCESTIEQIHVGIRWTHVLATYGV